MGPDRVGLGWRPELAAALLPRLDRIDVLEVLGDDLVGASAATLRSVRALGRDVPLVVHGTSLGLASAAPVDRRRLDGFARVVDALGAPAWSEHLAFVRADGVEIGHLAAPPRTPAVVDGLRRNVERARAVVGTAPHLENVATLVVPPGELDEAAFTSAAIAAAGTTLLLDLHNLHANAVNFGLDAVAFLDRIPLGGVSMVHVAGGRRIRTPGGAPRILDDHLHEAPAPVLDLLTELGRRVRRPLTVILERDGRYPPVDALMAEVDAIRAALARGRAAAA